MVSTLPLPPSILSRWIVCLLLLYRLRLRISTITPQQQRNVNQLVAVSIDKDNLT